MKKVILLLMVVSLVLSLTACGGKDTPESPVTDGTVSTTPGSNSSSNPSQSDVTVKNDSGEEAPDTTYDAAELKEEAAEMWTAFLNSVSIFESHMETLDSSAMLNLKGEDYKYAKLMNYYADTAEVFATHYAKYTGGDAQEYLDFNNYEKFLWYSTYVTPVMATTYSSGYFETLGNWNSMAVGNPYALLNNLGATEQAEAYKTLMEWQYKFLMKTGCIYNFMTEKTSAEENPNYVILDPAKRKLEEAENAQQEMQELQDELKKELEKEPN